MKTSPNEALTSHFSRLKLGFFKHTSPIYAQQCEHAKFYGMDFVEGSTDTLYAEGADFKLTLYGDTDPNDGDMIFKATIIFDKPHHQIVSNYYADSEVAFANLSKKIADWQSKALTISQKAGDTFVPNVKTAPPKPRTPESTAKTKGRK
jgi:hypothetical protein